MGVFDFFKSESRNQSQVTEGNLNTGLPIRAPSFENESMGDVPVEKVPLPEIPEKLFVEYETPKDNAMDEPANKIEELNLQTLYNFLQDDLEKKGYEDALINPDTGTMEVQVEYLRNQLNILISRVMMYYSNHVRNVDFHIESRRRKGLIETVDELISYKANIIDEMRIVVEIENDSKSKVGLSENRILSYKRGFNNGFAAITHNTILSRKPN